MTEPIAVNPSSVKEKVENLIIELELRKKQRDTASAHIGIEAAALAKASGDKKLWIKATTALTHYYSDITSEFDKAIQCCKEIIDGLDNDADAEAKSEFYRRLGLNNDYIGELIQSKQAYDKSVQLLEDKQGLSETGFLTLARSLFNESIIYGDLGLDTLKREYLHRAFGYFQKANYRPGIARCYISFGVDSYQKKELEKSLSYYEKAISIAEEINDTPPYCIAMGNSGIAYADLGQRDMAIKCAEKSIELVKNHTNKNFELDIYQMAGRVYQVVGDFEVANEWFTKAEKLYVEMGRVIDNFELFKYWAETLSALGRHEEAYAKLTRFVRQKDDLHELNKQAELSDVTLRFEYEEGKKEQQLLKKKNEEIEQYAHKLEMSNFELNQFAHVASHDLKEPLRTISNYSQLLTKSIGATVEGEQKEYLFYINEGAKRMMNVIQSLLELSKINSTNKKQVVDMDQMLNEVKISLKLNIQEKNAVIESDKLPSVFADRLHIGQLLQNLLSNAIKYNESGQPKIKIGFVEDDAFYNFAIEDNGIGIAPQYREKVFIIFQRLHHRYDYEGIGLGLSIC
ncbi:MAG TPA: ATP-binding protein, partial [Chitinophagales bacterium]|nr:ATP-binding protein [Chitinophagales bacterium]